MRLLEPGGEPDLAREPVSTEPLGQVGGKDLHDHVAAEGGLVGDEDTAHAAATVFAPNGVSRAQGALQLVAKDVWHGGHTRQEKSSGGAGDGRAGGAPR